MITYPLYAYFDANGFHREVDSAHFTLLGAWSSITAYTAFQAVTLGNSTYLCVTANSNHNPTAAQTVRYWSPLVVIDTGPDDPALGNLSVETLSAISVSTVNLSGSNVSVTNFYGTNVHIQSGTFTMFNTTGTLFNVVLQTTNGTTQFQFFPH